MVLRGTVLAVNTALRRQELQLSVRADEVKEGLEYFQSYGFAAKPVTVGAGGKGAEGIILEVDPDHRVVVVVGDRRFELRGGALKSGDAAIYSDLDDPVAEASGALHRLQLTRSGGLRLMVGRADVLDLRCGTSSIWMDGEKIRFEADEIETHARKRIHWDVLGYGEDWACDGSAWWVDVWKTGNVVPGVNENISPPEHDHEEI